MGECTPEDDAHQVYAVQGRNQQTAIGVALSFLEFATELDLELNDFFFTLDIIETNTINEISNIIFTCVY